MRLSCWGEPIIFEVVTGGHEWKSCNRLRGRLAVDGLICQPEAVKDRTNIGAELPLFSVGRGVGLVTSRVCEPACIYRPPPSEESYDESSYSQGPSRTGKYRRPLNNATLIVGVLVIAIGCILSGKAFNTLFFFDERKHGLPIIIFSFIGALICAAVGSFLLVRMT